MKNKLLLTTLVFCGVFLFTLTNCSSTDTSVHPLTHSWEKAIPTQQVPEGLTSLSAKSCGACHQDHYKEWKLSTHAHAWTDLQFQAELNKESSPLMCINCHIPLQNQQEYIVEGLIGGDIYKPVKKINPHFDRDLQQEGINCASCHVRNNVIIGPTGSSKAPHKTVKDTVFLSEQLCISCHNANAVITATLACTFETGDEWKSGPYFKDKNCISCHMLPVQREIVAGFGKRSSRLHYFTGSGIPKFDSVTTTILNGLSIHAFLPKKRFYINENIAFTLKVKNEFAGHKVPTGDPERYFNILFVLTDGKGDTLSTKTEYIGEHWEWYPEAKKLSDNNLLPKEERIYTFTPKAPQKGKLKLFVKVTKHRMNQATADYNKLGNNYPLFITIFDEEYVVEVESI